MLRSAPHLRRGALLIRGPSCAELWVPALRCTAEEALHRVLPKANLVDEASQCLRMRSGRNHRVYTAICLVTPKETFRQRLIETRVRFKRLSEDDIQAYIGSGEWRGKAGGYAVQGIAGSFVVKMVGSYTNVVGLPLYETTTLLGGEGFPIRFGWLNATAV